MKTTLIIIIAFLSALAVKAQEIQVPIDEKGNIQFIDEKLEKKLSLFNEYESVQEVSLFKISDTEYALEIRYKPNDILLKDRKVISEQELAEFRTKVSKAIENEAPEVALNQEGRTRLLVDNIVVSLGFYGWALPEAMGIEDNPRAFVGTYMLTSGAGFYLPFMLTKNRRVTNAAATLSFYGQTRGIAHGTTFPFLYDNSPMFEQQIGIGMAASIAEGLGGYYWADKTNMTSGRASTIAAFGDFGIGVAIGTAATTGMMDDFEKADRNATASLLVGSAAGIYAGNYLAKTQNYSVGDAFFVRGSGILGAYIPLAIAVVAEPKEEKWYTGVATFGGIGGMAFAHYFTKDKDFTTGQGVLICLGEIAGGLIGSGTGYLLSNDNAELNKVLMASSAIGALGGFVLMTNMYSKKQGKEEDKDISFNFNINPNAIFELATGKNISNNQLTPSLFSAGLRF